MSYNKFKIIFKLNPSLKKYQGGNGGGGFPSVDNTNLALPLVDSKNCVYQ